MLTRLACVVGLGLAVAVLPAVSAAADGGVTCPPIGMVCYVNANQAGGSNPMPAAHPTAPKSLTKPVCRVPVTGEVVSCSDPAFGWWSSIDGCYFQQLNQRVPASDPVWEGHYPNGAIYQMTCMGYPGTGGGWVWRATPPPGYGGTGLTVGVLAARAVAQLPLLGPDIGLAPDPAKTGLVGLPVWMWTRVSRSRWGPVSATASVPGMSVTATARAVRVVWDMGDGHRVTCTGPGTPYTKDAGATSSPTCGYRYTRSSATQPGATYTVTATTTWQIQWSGGGAFGQLTQTRSSSTRLRIGELQVLVS